MALPDIVYLARRLTEALERPLTSPGSERLALQVLEHFGGMDVMPHLAEKALETLRDGQRHDRVVVSPEEPRVALWFVAWNGTHREVQSERFGHYFGDLLGTGRLLAARGIAIGGILEIDAYLRDNSDPHHPEQPLDETLEVDVEYSYVPGALLGSSARIPGLLSKAVLLNPGLCSAEEQQLLQKLNAPG